MSVSKQSRPLQTVINYPLVRKEARALRLLIKSALIVLHIHCLKSECFVNLLNSSPKLTPIFEYFACVKIQNIYSILDEMGIRHHDTDLTSQVWE